MNKLSLKRRLTIFVASILIAITIILTSITMISVDRIMVKPQIDSLGFVTLQGRDGSISNVEILKRGDNGLVYRNPHSNHMKDGSCDFDNNNMMISNIRMAQAKMSRISLIAMFGIIIFGVVGVYIMVGRALDPLKELSTTIHEIGEDNLNTQIRVPDAKDEISSLIISFNKMLSRLEIMFQEQRNFSATAAHELKTPLTTMKTSLQVLQMDENPPIEEYKDSVVLLEKNIDRLIDTVNNLFLLSSDNIKLNDKVGLSDLIQDILEMEKGSLINRNIDVDLYLEDGIVVGNKDLLLSCFSNIISNAIKYNKENGKIFIKMIKEDKEVNISIRDTGIGLDKMHLSKVFESFYRVNEDIEGNGLGLSIVKNIVEEHSGTIDITSELGEGTEIIVTLPKHP